MKRKNKQKKIKGRLYMVRLLLIGGYLLVLGVVAYTQVVHGEEYKVKAITQKTGAYDVTITPGSGKIYDRNKNVLAVSIPEYKVIFDARVIAELNKEITVNKEKWIEQDYIITVLSEKLDDVSKDELKGYITIIDGKPAKNSHYVPIGGPINATLKAEIEKAGIRGVTFEEQYKRVYPQKTLAAQIIGYIGGGGYGYGLEEYYKEELSGIPGRQFISYEDANLAVSQYVAPEEGYSIVTTIDFVLQEEAEKIIRKYAEQYHPQNASILAMNPNTGEVLVSAAYPGFDLNDTQSHIDISPEELAKMTDQERMDRLYGVWKNYNVAVTFEPGSIFKPIVMAAALEEGKITEANHFFCNGVKEIYDRTIPCFNSIAHGSQNPRQILANSCNVGMMAIAEILGRDLFYQYQRDFGFGEATGIDLPGEESAAKMIYSLKGIGPVELATGSMGQGFNVTPIQILTAFSAIINGGELMRPYVVSQIVDSSGQVISETNAEIVRKVISKETSDTLRVWLQSVIDEGTGTKAYIEGYSIGGKTGTGQQGAARDEEVVTFIGYLPVEKPEFIAIAILDRPDKPATGSASAAPMLKEFLEFSIDYLSIPPSGGQTAKSSAGGILLEDYTGQNLMDTTRALQNLQLTYEVAGKGTIISSQYPEAGTALQEGASVLLYLTQDEDGNTASYLPDVVGLSYEEATRSLSAEGFLISYEGDEKGNVISQRPAGNVYETSGSTVHLVFEK